jgi:flagellar biosynthetic protein FlhB
MAEGEETRDKPHEPSQKRLDDARRKGDVPRSQDMAMGLSYGGLLIGLAFLGADGIADAGALGMNLIAAAGRAQVPAEGQPMGSVVDGIFARVALLLAPVFLLPAVLVLAGAAVQGQLVFAWTKIAPDPSRLSILTNARHKFGRRGLFEFAKSLVKLVVVGTMLAFFALDALDEIAASLVLSPPQAILLLVALSGRFLIAILAVILVIAAVDYLWQVLDWRQRHRMSHQEVRDEQKESEGDPHMKAQRRRRGMQLVSRKVVQAVRESDVVIVNPTHYAVALAWNRSTEGAPTCTAKGVDWVALRIREIAQEAGVPIHADPPTARALFATLEVGDMVQPDHYRPVAAAIRFAEALRRRALHRGE